jgi:hypothetical protein
MCQLPRVLLFSPSNTCIRDVISGDPSWHGLDTGWRRIRVTLAEDLPARMQPSTQPGCYDAPSDSSRDRSIVVAEQNNR